ncbi:MAG: hypothetical protein P8046_08895 [Anaerolineales bacterium]
MENIFDFLRGFTAAPGTLLETEHGLVMLLLLYGLLTYRGKKLTRWVPAVILLGIALSLFTPVHEIALFWPVITSLLVPPLLWQGAVAITNSGRLRKRASLLVWGIVLALVTFSLVQFSGLPLSNGLLLGVLVVGSATWFLGWRWGLRWASLEFHFTGRSNSPGGGRYSSFPGPIWLTW